MAWKIGLNSQARKLSGSAPGCGRGQRRVRRRASAPGCRTRRAPAVAQAATTSATSGEQQERPARQAPQAGWVTSGTPR